MGANNPKSSHQRSYFPTPYIRKVPPHKCIHFKHAAGATHRQVVTAE